MSETKPTCIVVFMNMKPVNPACITKMGRSIRRDYTRPQALMTDAKRNRLQEKEDV